MLSSALVLAVLLALPVLATAPTSPPLLERLNAKYFKINLFPDGSVKEISESETTFVMNGWTSEPGPPLPEDYPNWREMSGKEKNEFLKTASFELYIDDVPVRLHRNQWYDHVNGVFSVLYYVVFPSYTFEADTYEFRGEWSLDFHGTAYTHTSTVSVIVNQSS